LAPSYFAGFSEQACNAYSGTFCNNPVNCVRLQECVTKEKEFAQTHNRTAFGRYLNASPKIEDSTDNIQCMEAREYFGFNGELPDSKDNRICYELERLRETKHFTDLDEFANYAGDAHLQPSQEKDLIQPGIRKLI
jgi:hypothetical protein